MRRDVDTSQVRPRMMANGRLTTETLHEILHTSSIRNHKLTQKREFCMKIFTLRIYAHDPLQPKLVRGDEKIQPSPLEFFRS
jgi:hypothetical protein